MDYTPEQEVYNDTIQEKDGFYVTVNLVDIQPQTAANYGMFFIARYPCEIMRVAEVHGTAATNAGAVTLDVEKLVGTTAKGAGISVLATTFSLKSTANTVVNKEGMKLSNARQLKENERLALKSTGVLTDLKDVQVTLYFKFLGRGEYK